MSNKFAVYRNGGDGFIKWVEQEEVHFPIYFKGSDIPIWTPIRKFPPEYREFWSKQKNVLREALRMKNGRFIYKLIILCWMRGEGKSLLACLIPLWRFFNWPSQKFVLGANSKEQTVFVHYDIMRDIISHTPNLLKIVGFRNIQARNIRLKDTRGNITSWIQPISSFTGIISNITGYTFSEMHSMKQASFFTQLDGSRRNIPNSLGIIDTTVAPTDHVLYGLYKTWLEGRDPTLFFSHRESPHARAVDFWNPQMTDQELNSYNERFPKPEFDKYFRNVWEAGQEKPFDDVMIDCTKYIGVNGHYGCFDEVKTTILRKHQLLDLKKEMTRNSQMVDTKNIDQELFDINSKLLDISNIYKIYDSDNTGGGFSGAFESDLDLLGNIFNTGWAIITGFDRSDPMAARSAARTISVVMAKGLPNSRTHIYKYVETDVPNYIYILLSMSVVKDDSIEGIRALLNSYQQTYDGIDSLCSERWGMWDMKKWCESNYVLFEPVHPSYSKQQEMFNQFFNIVRSGYFKAPEINIPGSEKDDILREEMSVFYHNPDKKWYGSPKKKEKRGIQDDVIFASGWCILGGKTLGIESFRDRKSSTWFGTMIY